MTKRGQAGQAVGSRLKIGNKRKGDYVIEIAGAGLTWIANPQG